MADELKRAVARKGSFVQTVRAVAWSFFGVRNSNDQQKDLSQLNPIHIVIAGVVGAILFVVVLLLIVNWVTGGGTAGR